MNSRAEFCAQLADRKLTHVDRAVALLWYYRETQEFDNRSPSELATDLQEEHFPKPNVTDLKKALAKSKFTVASSRKGAFQIDVRRASELAEEYGGLLGSKTVAVEGRFIDPSVVAGTRGYLERLVHQINGTFEQGFYDGTAVLCRRLIESLLIEVYIHQGRTTEIRDGGAFFMLERLIGFVKNDAAVVLGRNSPKAMDQIKGLGDTAAHDRTYLTQEQDLIDIRPGFRRLVQELMSLSGIRS